MTQDEIVAMARDSGMELYGLGKNRARFVYHLERFANLVAAKATEEANAKANASWTLMCKKMVAIEREACAVLCDAEQEGEGSWYGCTLYLAEKIRARGEQA